MYLFPLENQSQREEERRKEISSAGSLAGAQGLGRDSTAFLKHLYVEQPGLEPTPIWDASAAGGGLACYTTMSVPEKYFLISIEYCFNIKRYCIEIFWNAMIVFLILQMFEN